MIGNRLAWVRRSGMGGLLALMAFGIFVLPVVVEPTADITWPSMVLLTLILVSGVTAIVEHRRLAATLIVLTIAVVVTRATHAVLPERELGGWQDVLLVAAFIVLAFAIGINVFASRRAVGDRLFGAIALYLLLGVIWAIVYALVPATVPHAFAGTLPLRTTFFDWGYFSLVTLTTLGYGDITPVAHVARSLAVLESLVGQLYPAIIIARLVSAQKVLA